MMSELRSRLTLLVVLALLGVGLAVIGTSVGATSPLAAGSGAAFVVSEDNVTFEHGDQRATVVDNMTHIDSMEIEQQGSGTYKIHTETEAPLTDSERSQAKTIARNNATVQQALEDLPQYVVTVEPIQKLTADSAQTGNLTIANTSTDIETAEGEQTFTGWVEESDETDTVTIDRNAEFVEDEAVVRITDPATDESYYSITVDLENETVTDITEWDTS
jgi:hypothetical protein